MPQDFAQQEVQSSPISVGRLDLQALGSYEGSTVLGPYSTLATETLGPQRFLSSGPRVQLSVTESIMGYTPMVWGPVADHFSTEAFGQNRLAHLNPKDVEAS